MGGRNQRGAGRIALVAMLSALSLAILLLANLSPMGRIGIIAAAGLVPAGAVISGGLTAGFFCYAVTTILSFLLLPDKGAALLYLLFFGLYPMIKSLVEQLHKPLVEWPLKLAFFNVMLSVLWFGMGKLFLAFLPTALNTVWLVYLVGNVVFVAYDIGFSGLARFYALRIDRAIQKRWHR